MQEMLERKVRDYFCNELQPMIIDGDRETKEERREGRVGGKGKELKKERMKERRKKE